MAGWHHWFSGHELGQIIGEWVMGSPGIPPWGQRGRKVPAAVRGVAKKSARLSNRPKTTTFYICFAYWRANNCKYPLLWAVQYSCLENPMDGGAWKAAVHGVAEGWMRLRDFTFPFMHWRRKWQPTPVFLPRESQGRGSLVGCRLWGRKSRTRLKWLSSSSSSRFFMSQHRKNSVRDKVIGEKWVYLERDIP